MRTMIAGVGYIYQRDLSAGPAVLERLRALPWPDGVEIEDWSIGPIHLVQRLESLAEPYDRVILVAATVRDREPGAVTCYDWDGALPDAVEVQQRVGESVMGVIDLDNLLTVAGHFGVFPRDVTVVEIEPQDTTWGDGFSAAVEEALDDVVQIVRRAALDGCHD
jgi:hydrogenase maturation protease